MKIATIGIKHTGEIYSTCLAELGNKVTGIDEDIEVIKNLNKGIPPLSEPKLDQLIKKNLKNKRLSFSNNFELIRSCDVVWITRDTPVNQRGKPNIKVIIKLVKKILPYLKEKSLLIVSSQLPAGSSSQIMQLFDINKFGYAYIPENFRLGEAVQSFMDPSWIVVGLDNQDYKDMILQMFNKFKEKILFMRISSSEVVKHATNAFLATSLSLTYDISDICEVVGADVTQVMNALHKDKRIGQHAYLDSSAGFSGGHLERELEFLKDIAKFKKIKIPVISAVLVKNDNRKKIVYDRLLPYLKSFKGRTISFFGITYKNGTSSISNSLSLKLAKEIQSMGGKINICDPFVSKKELAIEMKNNKYNLFIDPYKSVKQSSAIICITPWTKLKEINFNKIANEMKKPKVFFDARNYFMDRQNKIETAGIEYIGVGR